MKRQYRIIEHLGLYQIQTEYKRKVGIFRKHIKPEWRPIDTKGLPMINFQCQLFHKPFLTLQRAKDFIELIKKGRVIHDYTDDVEAKV